MEIALESAIPTYSGGLGVLAGDTLRGAADLGLPLVAVTLVHRLGYFDQQLDPSGVQSTAPDPWTPERIMELVPQRVSVEIEGRPVQLRAWRYPIRGVHGHVVPVYLLDADVTENDPRDRGLTNELYGGDPGYRLSQEAILGLGGVRLLHALGYADHLHTYHMNEGHSALAPLALLEAYAGDGDLGGAVARHGVSVRERCVFTTHTPVAAGHDQFPIDLVRSVLGSDFAELLGGDEYASGGVLNMTRVGLYFSRYATGVSMRHGQISRGMFPEHPIRSITNGVHAATWASPPFQALFDQHLPTWREENFSLRDAVGLPLNELLSAHTEAKQQLLTQIERRTDARFNPGALTIGFARRATAYKRPALLLTDLERLRRMAIEVGPLQVVYAGKAHPHDAHGRGIIRDVFAAAEALRDVVPIVYLADYDMDLARELVSGVDLWLNNPEQPLEASGTSGMKAALNGVPSLSVLDGWWIEGHIEGVTGWAIGYDWQGTPDTAREAESLYEKLEGSVLPLYHGNRAGYARVMRSAIAFNGSFFNAQRMLRQYAANAYRI